MSLLLGLALAGDEVVVSGRVESSVESPVRLEIILVEPGSPQLLLHEEVMEQAGPFRLTLPAQEGNVVLRASADIDLDGAGPRDPQAVLPLDLSGAPQTELVVTLVLPSP